MSPSISGLYLRRIFGRSLTSNDVRNVQKIALYGSFQPSTQAAEAEIQLENFRTFEDEAVTGNSYVFVYSRPRQHAFESFNLLLQPERLFHQRNILGPVGFSCHIFVGVLSMDCDSV